jgi:hypothetical protein
MDASYQQTSRTVLRFILQLPGWQLHDLAITEDVIRDCSRLFRTACVKESDGSFKDHARPAIGVSSRVLTDGWKDIPERQHPANLQAEVSEIVAPEAHQY